MNQKRIFHEVKASMTRCRMRVKNIRFEDLRIFIVEGDNPLERGECFGTVIRVSDTIRGVQRPMAHIVRTLAHEMCHALDASEQDCDNVPYAERQEEIRANKIGAKISRRYRRGLIH